MLVLVVAGLGALAAAASPGQQPAGAGGAEWMLWPRDVGQFLVRPNTSAAFTWNVSGGCATGAAATFNFTVGTYTACTPKCLKVLLPCIHPSPSPITRRKLPAREF